MADMYPALFYTKVEGNKVKCLLCPHQCSLGDGREGICRVRKNIGGELFTEVYGKACALRFDPVEKKPLYHFYPGSVILSVGTVGCNLHCKFCQNWEISQTCAGEYPYLKPVSPEQIIAQGLQRNDNIGIAFTYNEPTIFFEYMVDIARLAIRNGLKNVAITNGYINREPLKALLDLIDAFNVDLKAFREDFYRRVTAARLKPVKETILAIRKQGKHLELTNLVIPGLNDDPVVFEEMVQWIAGELGPETPLHLSRYFPNFQMDAPSTPAQVLINLSGIARKHLSYVFLGNLNSDDGSDTICPKCGAVAVQRIGYSTYKKGLTADGRCRKCEYRIIRHI